MFDRNELHEIVEKWSRVGTFGFSKGVFVLQLFPKMLYLTKKLHENFQFLCIYINKKKYVQLSTPRARNGLY